MGGPRRRRDGIRWAPHRPEPALRLLHGLGSRVGRAVRRPVDAAQPLPGDDTDRVLAGLSNHASRYLAALGAQDLTPYESRVFSQNGEDGVIGEILARIGTARRWFVEFGIGSGHQGNCVLLADAYGWEGLFCEPDPVASAALAAKYAHTERIRTVQVAINKTNVEAVFRSQAVPEDLDVLSIDIDGNDYWVWKAITSFRPRLVVIEYNSSLPERALVFPYDEGWVWDGTAFYGSSLEALRRLGDEKGYRLVHTDLCGVNAFFVRSDLADSVGVTDPPARTTNFGLLGLQMPPDLQGRRWVDLDGRDAVDAS